MRKDFSKLLTENPRLNSWAKYRLVRSKIKNLTQDDDQVGFKVGMKRIHSQYSWSVRDFNENLQPLRRFLESRRGLSWNDVMSEIRTHFPNNSTINNHIYQHLFDFVEINTHLRDGEIVYRRKYGQSAVEPIYTLRHDTFFVHPISKKLLSPPADTRISKKIQFQQLLSQYLRVIDSTFELKRLNGVWFKVHFKPSSEKVFSAFSCFNSHPLEAEFGSDFYKALFEIGCQNFFIPCADNKKYFVVSKKQLSYKELKKYNLKN